MTKMKKLIKETERELKDFSIPAIERLIKSKGYTTLYIGTPNADLEIERYNLKPYAKKKNAFIFCGCAKFVFVKKEFHYSTKQLLLLHELGHILLGHIESSESVYTEAVEAEAEADTFAYILLKRHERKIRIRNHLEDIGEKTVDAIKTILPFVLIVALLVGVVRLASKDNNKSNPSNAAHTAGPVSKQNAKPNPSSTPRPKSTDAPIVEENTVYITPYGECYHLATCGHKGTNAVPINREDINGNYRPCSHCRP